MAKTKKEFKELLQPLVEILDQSGASRLVAQANRVCIETADSMHEIEVDWKAKTHKDAMGQLGEDSVELEHVLVTPHGPYFVMQTIPHAEDGLSELIEDNWLNEISADVLNTAAHLQRNILVVGPWSTALPLIGALNSEALLPGILATAPSPAEPKWLKLENLRQGLELGCDRIAYIGHDMDELIHFLGSYSGAIAWCEARRIDDALMRLETTIEQIYDHASAPLHLLAGIDLVVVCDRYPEPRIKEIYELDVVEDGYRPRHLFAAPLGQSLVPISPPSFIEDIAACGNTVLVEQLNEYFSQSPTATAMVEPTINPDEDIVEEFVDEEIPEPQLSESSAEDLAALSPEDSAPPGWELDRLDESEVPAETNTPYNSDEANMAATFGLAPPRPPGGGAPLSTANFQEALAEIKKRRNQNSNDS